MNEIDETKELVETKELEIFDDVKLFRAENGHIVDEEGNQIVIIHFPNGETITGRLKQTIFGEVVKIIGDLLFDKESDRDVEMVGENYLNMFAEFKTKINDYIVKQTSPIDVAGLKMKWGIGNESL